MREFEDYDAVGLAELVRRGEVTPPELVEVAIQRIEARNPALNAVIHRMDEAARRQAEAVDPAAPLAGVPMLLKDLLAACAGQPLTNGSRFFQGFVPRGDCDLVRRYRQAGLVFLGKTNTPEFGITGVTEPALFGPARNPWDLTRTAGGSSGGSAAAVAAGMVPVAHGGDGGGSIRIPAACCGVFGLKPTRGRTPGSLPYNVWQDLVVEHALTRSVRDSAAALDATAGPVPGAMNTPPPPARPYLEEVGAPPGRLRIGVCSDSLLGRTLHPACRRAVEDTAGLLEELGHDTLPVDLGQFDWPAFARGYLTVVASEVRAEIRQAEQLLGRRATFGDFEPLTWFMAQIGHHNRGDDFVRAVRTLQSTGWQLQQHLARQGIDVLLSSTLASPPVEVGSVLPQGLQALGLKLLARLHLAGLAGWLGIDRRAAADSFEFTPNTAPFNLTGQPAMSVPLAWADDGLPLGMQFVGRFGDEATLFRLAAQLEEARPWTGRRPPTRG